MDNLTCMIAMTNGHIDIGIDKTNKVYYYVSMIRTYMMYAGLTFLGYEYGETEEAVLFRTRGKYGPPSNWNVDEYTATLIKLRELEKV